ncbi:hypothetical protein ACSSV6_003097 [Roseovarius sp. MBR-38]
MTGRDRLREIPAFAGMTVRGDDVAREDDGPWRLSLDLAPRE